MRFFFTSILAMLFNVAQAQSFKPMQINPFGINTGSYEYNDMQLADLNGDGAFDIIFNDFYDGPFIIINNGTSDNPDFNGAPMHNFISFDHNQMLGLGVFTDPSSYFIGKVSYKN